MQMSFLATDEPDEQISGLSCLPDFIDSAEEKRLLNIINGLPWLDDLRRRVQHYGYKYDYKARAVSQDLYLGPLPDWLTEKDQGTPMSAYRLSSFNAIGSAPCSRRSSKAV
jgi:hypothetical protein